MTENDPMAEAIERANGHSASYDADQTQDALTRYTVSDEQTAMLQEGYRLILTIKARLADSMDETARLRTALTEAQSQIQGALRPIIRTAKLPGQWIPDEQSNFRDIVRVR